MKFPVTGRSPSTVSMVSGVIWRPAFCSRRDSRPSTSAAGIKPTNWPIRQTETLSGWMIERKTHMPQTPHVEKHFTASETVRDIVIGMSDGLTVPFALAAGLSGAVEATDIIITAGLAEVAAGAIAMGLGGYLAAKTDAEHYASEEARERRETVEMPDEETEEVAQIFRTYGLPEAMANNVAHAI